VFDKLFRSVSRIPAEIECPACGRVEVRRLVSMPARGGKAEEGGGDGDSGAANELAEMPEKKVFGRKELEAAMRKKEQLKSS
jgi:hypothetical protein